MKELITKEIKARAAELRKEEAYRLGKMEAHQAGIDEAVKIVKKMQIQKPEHKGSEFSTPRDYHWRGYYTALDDTIKALETKK